MSHPRRDYNTGELRSSDLSPNPIDQFRRWFGVATSTEAIDEPYAMNVATVDGAGRPRARIVLMRDITDNGFVFFTNYQSDKGHDIEGSPWVALTFYWGPLERQVRIEGQAEKLSAAASDEYFASRPHRSKLGALVSNQSTVLSSRQAMESEMAELEQRFPEGTEVPRPTHWGGYEVTPMSMEFWQGRRSRLHDRLRYRREADGQWLVERLAP